MKKRKVLIIGGGPAGLSAASSLMKECEVHVYEKKKHLARKFLVAGHGGFNLTNSLGIADFYKIYTPHDFLKQAILDFTPQHTQNWLQELQIPTFVGTSGRIFPEKDIKPIEVLQAWKTDLLNNGVVFHQEKVFSGFTGEKGEIIQFTDETSAQKEEITDADAFVFALGGASWKKTGSDGQWLSHFNQLNVNTVPFEASNCGIVCPWPNDFSKNHAGRPLKNIEISAGNKKQKGEALITDKGLEGNAIYPLIGEIRKLVKTPLSLVDIDFKPNNTLEELIRKMGGKKTSAQLYKSNWKIDNSSFALIKAFTSKEEFSHVHLFAKKVKSLTIPVSSLVTVEESISTVGGIDLNELNENFSLKKHPHIYCIGEMCNWDAPTGGFLLQACFSMGRQLTPKTMNL